MCERRILKLAIAVVTVASALGLTSLGAGVPMAHASMHPAVVRPAVTRAAHISPDFTCPSGVTCFFSNNDYTGTVWEKNNQQYGGGVIHKFSDVNIPSNPGSARINGGSTLWVWNASNDAKACVYDGRIPLDHEYGYFWINYGVDTC